MLKTVFFVVAVSLLAGCAGQAEPRIADAQQFAIKRIAVSLQKHNRLHADEQSAYKTVKLSEVDMKFKQSIAEAKEDAEKNPDITKSMLADEILRRVEKRDQNLLAAQVPVMLMQHAQAEANKPAAEAAEMLGIVLQYEQTDGFSYTELVKTLTPLVPTPAK